MSKRPIALNRRRGLRTTHATASRLGPIATMFWHVCCEPSDHIVILATFAGAPS
jgi:hypothetical protein